MPDHLDVHDRVLPDSIPQLVTQLATDARDVAKAEIALAKAKALFTVTRYKAAAIRFAIAGVLGLAALIALLVGTIFSLATLIGPGWATLAVVGVVLLIAALLALSGKSALKTGPAA
ncbi:phage holin family protein [Sphingomonas sp. NPDC079357]|jgi:membrane-bound ClpP family serine protease|uniref:phage holin family protein n=1 Tax=Sphingomonas sp. NPDC079357 TaxID=3364518 RepID=UPI00384ABEB2